MIAAKVLLDDGFDVTVFERELDLGGTWSDKMAYLDLHTQQPGGTMEFSDLYEGTGKDAHERVTEIHNHSFRVCILADDECLSESIRRSVSSSTTDSIRHSCPVDQQGRSEGCYDPMARTTGNIRWASRNVPVRSARHCHWTLLRTVHRSHHRSREIRRLYRSPMCRQNRGRSDRPTRGRHRRR